MLFSSIWRCVLAVDIRIILIHLGYNPSGVVIIATAVFGFIVLMAAIIVLAAFLIVKRYC